MPRPCTVEMIGTSWIWCPRSPCEWFDGFLHLHGVRSCDTIHGKMVQNTAV